MGRSNSYRDRISKVVVDSDRVSVRGARGWKGRFASAEIALATPTARKLARVLVALSIGAILFCGLFPFDFAFQSGWNRIGNHFDGTLIQRNTAGDSFENILFFLPLGFSLAAIMRKRWLRAWIGNALVATAIGMLLSLTVELLQCYLGERDPSLTDVVNNTIGTAVGFGIYRGIGAIGVGLAVEQIDRARRAGSAPLWAAIATAAWAALVCAAPLVLGSDSANFSQWNPNFPLAVGNEINAQRWWEGTVHDLHIASRAVTPAEADALLAEGAGHRSPADVFGSSLVASYDLRPRTSPYPDASGHNSPLEWSDKLAQAANATSRPTTMTSTTPAVTSSPRNTQTRVDPPASPATQPSTRALELQELLSRPADDRRISNGRFLRTPDGVVNINRAIVKTDAFTILTTVTSVQTNLGGPARIITISGGDGGRNITIGQQAAQLAIRLHMPVTGTLARSPQFNVDEIFADNGATKHILITFADATLRVYVNGTSWRAATRITPESTVVWSMYPRDFWQFHMATDDVSAPSAVYRAIAMMPLAILATASINLFRAWTFRRRLVWVIAIVGGTMIIMESLLALHATHPFQIMPTLFGTIAAIVGVLVVKISHRTKPTDGGVISLSSK